MKIIRHRAVAIAACHILLFAGACTSPRLSEDATAQVHAVSELAPPDPATSASREFVIGPLDILTILIIGNPDLSGEAQVDTGGNLTLPLIGTVPAAGRTPAALAGELTSAYRGTYLKNPRVSVGVKEIKSQFVTLDGQVQIPGIYALPGRVTLTGALALGRGANEFAALENVAVFRTVNGQRTAAIFDLGDIRTGRQTDPEIYASDVIVVGNSPVRRVFRDVVSIAPFLGIFRPF